MEKNIFAKLIANALQLQEKAVANTLSLLEEGCTIPFISRYRKERTGGLDEVQIAAISDRFDKLKHQNCSSASTPAGMQRNWRTSICRTDLSEGQEPRLPENKDWSLWPRFSCFKENGILSVLPPSNYPLSIPNYPLTRPSRERRTSSPRPSAKMSAAASNSETPSPVRLSSSQRLSMFVPSPAGYAAG